MEENRGKLALRRRTKRGSRVKRTRNVETRAKKNGNGVAAHSKKDTITKNEQEEVDASDEQQNAFITIDEALLLARDVDDGFPKFEPKPCPPFFPWSTYKGDKHQVLKEVLAGFTVAFAQIPESIAFTFLAGLSDPSIGLHAAWIMGLGVALFGYRPAMVNGCTGAVAAVLQATMLTYGVSYLPGIIMLCGFFEVCFGLFRLAKFVRMIPITVMMGFTNGLAIVIGKEQIHYFRISLHQSVEHAHEWLFNVDSFGGVTTFVIMIVFVLATMFIVEFMPRLTKLIPASLVAIVVTIGAEQVIRAASSDEISTPVVGEFVPLEVGPPLPFFLNDKITSPSFSWETVGIIVPAAFFCAGVASIEHVLTMEVASDRTNTQTISVNAELIVLGLVTFVSGFFGTMGGGAMIGLTMIVIHSGANGRYRISTVVASVTVLFMIMVAAPLIKLLPTSTLVGIMAIVVIHTFNFGSVLLVVAAFLPEKMRQHPKLSLYRKVHRSDALVIVTVTVLTLVLDLFFATIAGMLIAAFAFAWDASQELKVRFDETTDEEGKEMKIYTLNGPVFFGTVQPLTHLFTAKSDPDIVEVHMSSASIFDYSGIDALNNIGEKYAAVEKSFHVRHLCTRSTRLATKANQLVKFSYSVVGEKLCTQRSNRLHLDTALGVA